MTKKRPDQDFLDWVSYQPSCLSGVFSEWDSDGDGRSMPSHVRRSSESGTGYKPLHSAIPLTFEEHSIQSAHGELALLKWWAAKHNVECHLTVEEAKAVFDKHRDKYRELWFKGKTHD